MSSIITIPHTILRSVNICRLKPTIATKISAMMIPFNSPRKRKKILGKREINNVFFHNTVDMLSRRFPIIARNIVVNYLVNTSSCLSYLLEYLLFSGLPKASDFLA